MYIVKHGGDVFKQNLQTKGGGGMKKLFNQHLEIFVAISCLILSCASGKEINRKGNEHLYGTTNVDKLPGHANGAHIFRTMSQRAQHLSRLEHALLRLNVLIGGPL